MKKVAVLAIALGALSGMVQAEDRALQEVTVPTHLDLAMRGTLMSPWLHKQPQAEPASTVGRAEADSLTDSMARVSARLDEQLEAKIKQDLINAM